jgi:hypothetical protein
VNSLNPSMSAYQMSAVGVLIAGLTGIPSGWIIWGRTHDRSAAVVTGLVAAALAVAIAAWLYYSRVLCPPGAGCV